MRDYLPEDMIPRENLMAKIKETFRLWGFVPVETPAIELTEILNASKMGTEATKLIYHIVHDDGLALRYDLTVPIARLYAANRRELGQPFKRYQIQPVWRAERAQPKQGRFREFYQCDVDILATKSLVADAEIVSLAAAVLDDIGFEDIDIQVNHRQLLHGMVEYAGFDADAEMSVCQSMDKLDKIGEDGVKKELLAKEYKEEHIQKLFELKDYSIEDFKDIDNERLQKGIRELDEFFSYLEFFENSSSIHFSPSLARGLDYYTGIIFEAQSKALPKIGSLAGGGRYDELIGVFDKQDIPAVGITIGLDRILVAAHKAGLLEKKQTITKVMIAYFSDNTLEDAIKTANKLRRAGISSEAYLQNKKMGKQFSYADRLNIPFVIVIGPDEAKDDIAQIKIMATGEQFEVSQDEIVGKIQSILDDQEA